tara:strand:+ start:2147 stop:2374 length:228 start_codon:yes stop_codon:yes gene_type:complete
MSPELIAIITFSIALAGFIWRSSWWASGLSVHVENIDTNLKRLVGDIEKMEDKCVAHESRIDNHETRITVLEATK